MKAALLTVEIRYEHDVVLARQRARQIAELLGFDRQQQTRIATAVSEIARNGFQYAAGPKVEFAIETDGHPAFQISVRDRGPGIRNLEQILDGQYRSQTGMGLGIVGARRLMDGFQIESAPGTRTTIVMQKQLPRGFQFTPQLVTRIADDLSRAVPQNPFEELQRQNQELLGMMGELERRQRELAQLNQELEDTNRGVVALYAELDERADYLRRASEIKSRFLSNMTHEFRTPLNSILSLSRLLLDRLDGELNSEQEKQVTYINRAASDLSELVNDLLDLAKVEAGKVVVRPAEFSVSNLFSALRGMLRPLLAHNSSVNLVFEDVQDVPTLRTDESKLSQILRNFISNAIKFTQRGEIRVSARSVGDEMVTISVSDTGVGIAPENQSRIFDEFGQIEGEHQRNVKGTGLGLPLSRKLAELLGGNISVRSQPGVGSVFSATLPIVYHGPAEVTYVPEVIRDLDSTRMPVLVIEDNSETLFVYDKYLKGTGFQTIPAQSIQEALTMLHRTRPVAIFLDILLGNDSSWQLLADLKADNSTRNIPVFVASMVDNRAKALSLGAADFALKPLERSWLLEKLSEAVKSRNSEEILIIDDDEASRYLLRGLLQDTKYHVLEAAGGHEGLRLAESRQPKFIFLDLGMPDLNGFEVLDRLKLNPKTMGIPVIISTAKLLSATEKEQLGSRIAAILSKDHSSREHSLENLRRVLSKVAPARRPVPPPAVKAKA